jgi:hypothetical protein
LWHGFAVSRSNRSLERRVIAAAEEALARQQYVSPLDIMLDLRWLHPVNVDPWRRGRLNVLQEVATVPTRRLAEAIEILGQWAADRGLIATEAQYVAATRDRRPLRFTTDGDPGLERLFRVHWSSPERPPPDNPEPDGESTRPGMSGEADLVVIEPLKAFTCSDCGQSDSLLIMDRGEAICMSCADMDHLVFLASGDAALTRRARKASGLSAVVVRFSRARRRYERQGILVVPEALEEAEQQCLADEEVRLRRRERDRIRRDRGDVEFTAQMEQEIMRLFPRCPARRAAEIARHTGERGSGRVGRTAEGRAFDEHAVTAAVVASVRHTDTDYDALLMSGLDRHEARDRVRADIDRILGSWR